MQALLTNDTLARIFSANRAVADASTPAQWLEAIVSNAVEPTPDRCLLLQTDQDRAPNVFAVIAGWDRDPRHTPTIGAVYHPQNFPLLRFLGSGESIVIQDATDPRLGEVDRTILLEKLTACLVLPLRARRRWAGALIIETRSGVSFDATSVQFYEALADALALSMNSQHASVQLGRTRSLLEGLVENGRYAHIVADLRGIITAWSPAAEALYGYTAEQAVNQSLAILNPEIAASDLISQCRAVAREQRPLHKQIRRISKSGQALEVLMTMYPVYGLDNNVVGVAEISVEHSDRVLLQSAVQKERDHLEAILEATNDAIIMLDLDQRVVTANLQFETFFGIPRYPLVGHGVDEMIRQLRDNPDYPTSLINVFLTLSGDSHQSAGGDIVMEKPKRRTLVWYSSPVYAHDGTILGRLFVFRDATQERESDRMKTEFVSLVSHELRTPLTSVKGFTDLLLDGDAGPLEKTVNEYVNVIKFNTDRLIGLVNDILDITRLESGHMEVRRSSVDLRDAIANATRPMGPIVEQKKQSLAIHVAPDLPPAFADPNRLAQILTNLLANASKYTPQGGDIRIEARLVSAAEMLPLGAPANLTLPALLVGVHDTGMGIAPEDQPNLFSRFYRTPVAVKRQLAGSGLGLSIVKSFVELQGGVIWLKSEVERGSSFYFTLRLSG